MIHARRLSFALLTLIPLTAAAEDWPRWRGPGGDGVWNETGIVEKFASATLPRKWTAEIGAGYTSPTVAQGRVYLMDRPSKPAATERVLCFDEQTGQELWKVAYQQEYGDLGYQAGPRAAVTIDGPRAYSLGARGRLHSLGAADGKVIWEKDLEKLYDIEMPIWGISGSPLIFQDVVVLHIGGKDGACIVALNKHNGDLVWKALNDRAQYTTPVLVEQGGQPVLICWTGDSVSGVAAGSGDLLWQHAWKPKNMPIGIATPVVEKDRVFFTSFYDGSLMLKLAADKPECEVVWKLVGSSERNTDALHSIISTPVFDGGHIYGVDSYGELRCLDAADGRRLWENKTATPEARWSTIHFVKNGDKYWLFNERGELIIARLSPQGFEEISRAKLLEPTTEQLRQRGGVCWSHPAFANKCVFQRSDKELVCAKFGGRITADYGGK